MNSSWSQWNDKKPSAHDCIDSVRNMGDKTATMPQTKSGPFTNTAPLVLASGSPRRKELLANLGIHFIVHPSDLEEPLPAHGEEPGNYACRMAEMKTRDVASRYPDMTVLGADTIVALDDRIMGKPTDSRDALEMLLSLSGKTHQVVTGYCIMSPERTALVEAVSTDVDMRRSSTAELQSYIATGEPMDKAGAYAIQGIGTFLVTGIRGSYTNVVGLPLARVMEKLTNLNVIAPLEGDQ